MRVEVVCTNDDPTDSLEYHKKIKDDGFEIRVLSAFRPDKGMYVDDVNEFNTYVMRLEKISGSGVTSFQSYIDRLKKRHDFFAAAGCTFSDDGLEFVCAEDVTDKEIDQLFYKIRGGKDLFTQ